jgi:hypothetical protein
MTAEYIYSAYYVIKCLISAVSVHRCIVLMLHLYPANLPFLYASGIASQSVLSLTISLIWRKPKSMLVYEFDCDLGCNTIPRMFINNLRLRLDVRDSVNMF